MPPGMGLCHCRRGQRSAKKLLFGSMEVVDQPREFLRVRVRDPFLRHSQKLPESVPTLLTLVFLLRGGFW